MSFGSRLSELLNHFLENNIAANKKDFCAKLGLDYSNLSKYLNDKFKFSIDAENIHNFTKYQIDINWLLTGNGEMFIKSEDSSSASSANINQPEKTNQIPSVENVKDVSNEKELIKYLSRLLTESQQETDDIKDKYEELRRENIVLKGIKDGLSAAIVSVEQKKIEK